MINVLFVVAVLAFIVAAAFAIAYKVRSKELEEKYWEENRLHFDAKVCLEGKYHAALDEISELEAKRFEQWERAEVLEQKNIDLKHELSERPLPIQDADENTEQGNFVRTKRLKRATPETYRVVFDLDLNGQRILEHLTQKYCRNAFSNTDRETNYKLGQQSVVAGIINEINKANDPNYSEVENDA
ncbi:hypothetical protein [Acinetobacter pittii]|uniref:Bbp19 family protein n=1 Tax=Acinetobacter pittii TaxID=48296 RepID=UPI0025B031DA|nr:hypothetical protein [Acinetobacter pittii]